MDRTAPRPGDCLSETVVSQFLDQGLSSEAAHAVERHIDGCAACRRLVSALARGASPGDEAEVTTAPWASPSIDDAAVTQVGRYRITGVLGSGGMGTVFAASDPELDRSIAVKLLRPRGRLDDDRRARLAREAQALARISHPNVVAVYDIGSHGDQIFIAMERVGGGTLRTWLAAEPRSWREIVAIFAATGQGLAAVHDHGLIHRDFKPDNVLVDRDRPRVSDFGLAAPGDATVGSETGEPAWLPHTLTATGQVLGTPAYMAPEQFAGVADSRSDQFSFCVSLYEALYGERPFAASTAHALVAAVVAGAVRPAPTSTKVPGWLRVAVLRGLHADPARRFPSMRALLAAIDRDPARSRRRWFGAFALAGALAGGSWYWGLHRGAAALECGGSEQALAGAWDPARRSAIGAAFRAVELADSPAIGARITALLDERAAQWRGRYRDTCLATRVRRTQSEHSLDLRMSCLAERKNELRALTDRLARIDAAAVDRALDSVRRLPSVGACDDVAALDQVVRPADPAVRARADELRRRLAEVRAITGLQPAHQALAAARQAVAEVTIDDPPLVASAQLLLGNALEQAGVFREAEAAYRAAASAADRGRDDRLRCEAWISLFDMISTDDNRSKEVDGLPPLIEAALVRAGGDRDLTERWQLVQATALIARGQPQAAAARFGELMTAFAESYGPDDSRLASAAVGYAAALQRFGTATEIAAAVRRANELRARAYGSGTSERRQAAAEAVDGLLFQAISLIDGGKAMEALAMLGPAQTEITRWVGPIHESVATVVALVGYAHGELGQLEDARANHARALAIRRTVFGAQSAQAADSLIDLARIALRKEDYSTAVQHATEGLRIYEASAGPDSPKVGSSHLTIARALLALGQLDDALPHATRSVALGKGRPWYGGALTVLGELQLHRDELARGIVTLEQALEIREALAWDAAGVAQTQLALARGRAKQGRPKEAIELAERATAAFERLKKDAEAKQARAFAAALR